MMMMAFALPGIKARTNWKYFDASERTLYVVAMILLAIGVIAVEALKKSKALPIEAVLALAVVLCTLSLVFVRKVGS